MKIQIGRDDVNPNKPDRYGQTPLAWASCFGFVGIVEILLGRDDIDPDQPDEWAEHHLVVLLVAGTSW